MRTMPQALRFNRFAVRLLLTVAALALSVPATAAAAILAPKQHGPLSPELLRLGAPALSGRSAAQQAAALGLPLAGPGSLIRAGKRVLVDIRVDASAPQPLHALRGVGAQIVSASRSYQTVIAAVPPEALRQLGSVSGVGSVTAVPAPLVFASECEGGSV